MLVDHELAFRPRFVRDGGRVCVWEVSGSKIVAPQRAQDILAFELLTLEIMGEERDDVLDDSCRRLIKDIGSIVSCPAWIAESTERRESQLREGARSSRTVGSL